MQILLVAATALEIAPLKSWLDNNTIQLNSGAYQLGLLQIDLLITGIGMMQTCFHLTKSLSDKQYDLVINAGIAGSFKPSIPIGAVVNIVLNKLEI